MTNEQVIDYVDRSFYRIHSGLQCSLRILNEIRESPAFKDDTAQAVFRIAINNLETDMKRVQTERQDAWNFLQIILPVGPDGKNLTEQSHFLQDNEPG